jgi:hypothetical protein
VIVRTFPLNAIFGLRHQHTSALVLGGVNDGARSSWALGAQKTGRDGMSRANRGSETAEFPALRVPGLPLNGYSIPPASIFTTSQGNRTKRPACLTSTRTACGRRWSAWERRCAKRPSSLRHGVRISGTREF